MYLIVGLGNPEKEYGNTRHNMGFNVINKIAEDYSVNSNLYMQQNRYKVKKLYY